MKSRRYAVVPGLVLGALVAQAGLASPAQAAAQRYATPTGAGTACTVAAPCSLVTAVNSAAAGDEVIVAPGTYTTDTPLSRSVANLNIHGVAGAARPVLNSSAGRAIDFGQSATGTRITDLVVVHTGGEYGLNVFAKGSDVTRVQVLSTGAVACSPGISGVLRDSLCVTSAAGGIALDDSWSGDTGTLALRNVTAIATGAGSYGIRADASGSNTNLDVDARNVIAGGTAADVRATESGSNSESDVSLRTSNYDTQQEAGGGAVTNPGTLTNQTAAPVFADLVTFHQTIGSPTVNAGSTYSGIGATDYEGELRAIPAGLPDIGADEYDPTPPDTAFTRKPKGKTRKRKVTFFFAASEPSSFVCVVDKKQATPCASPYRVKAKRYGRHKITIYAVDAVGNVDPTPAVHTWKHKRKPKKKRG